MLFYTGIFLAILIALLVARLIYKAVFLFYKAVSSASEQLGSSDKRFAISANDSGHLTCGAGNKAVTGPLITPGANNHVTAWNLAKTHPVVNEVNDSKNNVWPPRETIGASVGRAFKVTRYDGGPKRQTLDMVSKPFRRNVAPDTPTPETASNPLKGNADSKISTPETVNKLIMKKEVPVKSGDNTESKPWGW